MSLTRTEPDTHGPASVTFVGHSTVLISVGHDRILTDPIFSERVGRWFTPRSSRLALEFSALSRPTAVLISHIHHDHLDYPSLRLVDRATPIIVPWGIAPLLRLRGFRDVRVLHPGQDLALRSCTVTAVPARHFGGRLPLLYTAGCQGYVIRGDYCLYFAGDTGFRESLFREIAKKFQIDVAILPIAGYVFPTFRRNHMNSADALDAFRILGARKMIPIHFEAFTASFEPKESPRAFLNREAARRGVSGSVVVPTSGQVVPVD